MSIPYHIFTSRYAMVFSTKYIGEQFHCFICPREHSKSVRGQSRKDDPEYLALMRALKSDREQGTSAREQRKSARQLYHREHFKSILPVYLQKCPWIGH